jgi:hypothetical protein
MRMMRGDRGFKLLFMGIVGALGFCIACIFERDRAPVE